MTVSGVFTLYGKFTYTSWAVDQSKWPGIFDYNDSPRLYYGF